MSQDLSPAEGRALVETCFPNVPIRTCEPMLGGWDHLLLLVNRVWVFRIPHRREVEDSLEMELRLLPRLAPELPVAVPRYEKICRREGSPRILAAYRRIPGASLTRKAFRRPSAGRTSMEMAAFLTALHAFPVGRAEEAGIRAGSPETWRRRYEDFYEWIRTEAFPRLRERERSWAQRTCEAYLGDASHFRFTPVLIHHDLEASHILLDARSGRITGVIDWGDAGVGDPAFDFAGLWMDLGESVTRRVLRRYRGPRDAALLERTRFYADVAPFYGIVYGRQLGHPEWTREGMMRLRLHAR